MTPGTTSYASDRAAFLRLLGDEAVCDECRARFAAVTYLGIRYCGACALDLLVTDRGLALPALAAARDYPALRRGERRLFA